MYQSLGFDSRKDKRLSLGHHIQTDSGIHVVSYTKLATGIKWPEREAQRVRDIFCLYINL